MIVRFAALVGMGMFAVTAVAACGGAEAAKELEAIADKVCACKDAECATKAMGEITTWLEKHKDTRGSEADANKAAAAAQRAGECVAKVAAGGAH